MNRSNFHYAAEWLATVRKIEKRREEMGMDGSLTYKDYYNLAAKWRVERVRALCTPNSRQSY